MHRNVTLITVYMHLRQWDEIREKEQEICCKQQQRMIVPAWAHRKYEMRRTVIFQTRHQSTTCAAYKEPGPLQQCQLLRLGSTSNQIEAALCILRHRLHEETRQSLSWGQNFSITANASPGISSIRQLNPDFFSKSAIIRGAQKNRRF